MRVQPAAARVPGRELRCPRGPRAPDRSLEPAFTAVFSGLVTGKWQHPMVYATLVPVMGGVAYASASEVSFNMTQFISAMVSPPPSY